MKILKFSTPTCTYCKVVSPHIEEYAKEKGYEVLEINADSESNSNIDKQYSELYRIQSVPVMVVEPQSGEIGRPTKLVGLHEIMSYVKE